MKNKTIDINQLLTNTISKGKIYGKDEYCDEILEYPECYAKFLISLYYTYITTRDSIIKKKASKYIDILNEICNQDEYHVWWGLPFNWGDTKKDDGFLITTCFCIQALSLWSKEGLTQYNTTIKKAIAWCFSLITFDMNLKEKGFLYSPKLKINIYNATSIACGTLFECERFLSQSEKEELYSVIEGLINAQNEKGYWNYSKFKCDVDLLHQCYTVEGIIKSLKHISDDSLHERAYKCAQNGVEFIINKMSYTNMERYLFELSDKEKLTVKLKYLLLQVYKKISKDKRHFLTPRCWSYAAYIRILIDYYKLSHETIYLVELKKVIEFVKKNIFIGDAIIYREHDKREFVRHRYHMIEALSYSQEAGVL